MTEIGKWLVILGGLILLTGLVLMIAPRLPWIGRLPGDFTVQRENLSCTLLLGTSLLLSLLLTLLCNLIAAFWRK